MKAKFMQLVLGASALCFFLNSASANEITVGDLSARIDDLENKIGAGGPPDPDFPNGNGIESPETLDAIRKLEAKAAEIDHRLAALEAKQLGAPIVNAPQKISHDEPAGSVAQKDAGTIGNMSQEDSILKLLEEASPSDPQSKKLEQEVAIEKTREEATKKAEETAPTLTQGGANAQYNQAFSLYEKGEYAPAENAFQHVIDTYPNDPAAKKAQFWLGESCFAQKKNAEAKLAFVKAYKNDPKGPKAPDCLLKLGLVLAAQNKKSDACTAWKKLVTDYPNMPKETKKALDEAKKKYGCK